MAYEISLSIFHNYNLNTLISSNKQELKNYEDNLKGAEESSSAASSSSTGTSSSSPVMASNMNMMPSVNRATTVNCRLQPGIANINQSDQSCWIDLVISASNESLILVCIPRDSITIRGQSIYLSTYHKIISIHSTHPLLPSFSLFQNETYCGNG